MSHKDVDLSEFFGEFLALSLDWNDIGAPLPSSILCDWFESKSRELEMKILTLAFGHSRHHADRWRDGKLRQLRRNGRDWLSRHRTLGRQNSIATADPGKIDRQIVRRGFAVQQAAPGLHRALGFPDVFEKGGLAVIAARAAGLEQFGEIVQPLLGKSTPARNDVASPRDVGSICHQKARKRKTDARRYEPNQWI